MQCVVCSAPIRSNTARCCSFACNQEYQYRLRIALWLSGNDRGYNLGDFNVKDYIKKYFRLKYHNSCQRCEWSKVNPFTGSVPLQMHHVDGNYENCGEENLEILCPNCHALTSTYAGANKIAGRPKKR